MAEPSKNPQDDEHIEDLLSQLQGIFGRLSKTEAEESGQKVDVKPDAAPVVAPAPVAEPPAPAPVVAERVDIAPPVATVPLDPAASAAPELSMPPVTEHPSLPDLAQTV